jgi:hypothetical protein
MAHSSKVSKGKLEATVQAHIISPSLPTSFTLSSTTPSTITKNHPALFKIKIGHMIASSKNHTQMLLYMLLAFEQNVTAVLSGVLHYMQSEKVVKVWVG